MEIEVTQEDISTARKLATYIWKYDEKKIGNITFPKGKERLWDVFVWRCPIALALERMTGVKWAVKIKEGKCGAEQLLKRHIKIVLSDGAVEFTQAFDAEQPVQPMIFSAEYLPVEDPT